MSKPTVTTQPLGEAMPEVSAPNGSTFMKRLSFVAATKTSNVKRKLTTKEGWLGSYDYAALCMPRLLPWSKHAPRGADSAAARSRGQEPSFYGLHEELPIGLAAICGLQHCLCMLAGIITPPIILSSTFNLAGPTQSYLISASLITSGLLSMLQMSAFRLPLLGGRQIGTGLLSVVGTSFATLGVTSSIAGSLYADGTCPMLDMADGSSIRGPCPEGFGYILGTSAVCALFEIFLSFLPPRTLQRVFPKFITGPVVLLIGVSLLGDSGFVNWGGGASCHAAVTVAGKLCPSASASRPLPWGSPELIGMGFYSFVVICLIELFGSPAMRNVSIVIALVFCTITAGIPGGYTTRAPIDAAPSITFLWVQTFPLKVLGSAVLPLLVIYLVLAIEAIGDTSASATFSRVATSGPEFERRLSGAVLSDGIAGVLSALFTVTPMSVFAQNVAAIQLTSVANRGAGFWCCFWLILFGILGKISGAVLAIPNPILGGVTSFLFSSVATAGLSLISQVKLTRRTRFILASELLFGFGNLLIGDWATAALLPKSSNKGLESLLQSIQILLSTPYLISAIAGMILNTILPFEREDFEMMEEERSVGEAKYAWEAGATAERSGVDSEHRDDLESVVEVAAQRHGSDVEKAV